MFPSWVFHQVRPPYHGEVKRISSAFNLAV